MNYSAVESMSVEAVGLSYFKWHTLYMYDRLFLGKYFKIRFKKIAFVNSQLDRVRLRPTIREYGKRINEESSISLHRRW